MSRPFSYNDENFTVNGNALYVHVKYEDAAKAGTRLIEIPPAIFDRLLFYSNISRAVYRQIGATSGSMEVGITNYNNKHYLTIKVDIGVAVDRYIYAIYLLKDV